MLEPRHAPEEGGGELNQKVLLYVHRILPNYSQKMAITWLKKGKFSTVKYEVTKQHIQINKIPLLANVQARCEIQRFWPNTPWWHGIERDSHENNPVFQDILKSTTLKPGPENHIEASKALWSNRAFPQMSSKTHRPVKTVYIKRNKKKQKKKRHTVQ